VSGWRHTSGEEYGVCGACLDDDSDDPNACQEAIPDAEYPAGDEATCGVCGHRVELDAPIAMPAEACE